MQQLEAHEKPLAKIFCGDYDFQVPHFQRPYAWGTEQAAELLDDLSEACERNVNEPYFLGSIVLIKQSGSALSSIIDGQQRLTTLTILFSVLSSLAQDTAVAAQLWDLIVEPGAILKDLPAKPRLELGPKDAAFFKKYVQTQAGLDELLSLPMNVLSDAQKAIQANARLLHHKLSLWSAERRLRLSQLMVQRTYLVVVSTPDLTSAHRIFSVMNTRGLDLAAADVFKSQVIGAIEDTSQQVYAHKWEDAEESLGRSDFGELFLHLRMVFGQRRARNELLKEFPEQVLHKYQDHGGMATFIDDELVPYARAFRDIREAAYLPPDPDSDKQFAAAAGVNAWFRRLAQLDNNDWRPAALWALRNHPGDPEFLNQFLARLERLAATMFIRRLYTSPRVDRYVKLLTELALGAGLEATSFNLSDQEAADTLAELDGELYLSNSRVRKYVLLRLDELLAAEDGPIFLHKLVTIEHVLPQNPPADSQWMIHFGQEQRKLWTNRLANLVLLNRYKNSVAGNLEFEQKKAKYFKGKSGVMTYALTLDVLSVSEWTPDTLHERQDRLLGMLSKAWGLGDCRR
jgi:hypothetical protein